MPYKVTIKTGLKDVVVGGNGPFQGGDIVLLTDEQYAAIRPGVFTSIFEATPTALNTTSATPYA